MQQSIENSLFQNTESNLVLSDLLSRTCLLSPKCPTSWQYLPKGEQRFSYHSVSHSTCRKKKNLSDTEICWYYRHTSWFSDMICISCAYMKTKILNTWKKHPNPKFYCKCQFCIKHFPVKAYSKTFFFWLAKNGIFFQYSDYYGKTLCLHLQGLFLDKFSS